MFRRRAWERGYNKLEAWKASEQDELQITKDQQSHMNSFLSEESLQKITAADLIGTCASLQLWMPIATNAKDQQITIFSQMRLGRWWTGGMN